MSPHLSRCLRGLLGAFAIGAGSVSAKAAAADEARLAFFEQRIRPVLAEHCYECHSTQSKKLKGGLRLDSKGGVLRGGDTKAPVVPGDAGRSLLIEAVGYANPNLQMPPKARLPDALIADLTRWVNDGAIDPRDGESAGRPTAPAATGRVHWAFQPIRNGEPPKEAGGFSRRVHPIDQFIATKLKEHDLAPAPMADRRTLIRRAAYDLNGLPPTTEQIAAFLNDPAKDAFERVIDRLLASPRYGERWGRWWLDVARYADSNGQDENKVMANAWRYRDWVIRSFNANQSFDAFITEQLAGDLLPTNGLSEQAVFDRWTATGLLVIGPKMLAEQDKPKLVMDLVDEQIDVVSRAFLGLTVGCARCHDHKFDPIPARDYYALAGIFRSTKTMANLSFVSKFNERRITGASQLAALEAHDKAAAAKSNEVFRAIQNADQALRADWRTHLGKYLTAASSPASSAQSSLPTNLVTRLRGLMAPDPSTNLVSRTLRRLVSEPAAIATFLEHDGNQTGATETHDALFAPGGVFALPKDPRPYYPAATREAIVALETACDAVKTNGPPPPAFALAVEEDKPVDLPVHIRGSHLNLAKDPVPRGFIQIASKKGSSPLPAHGSGRVELARWLTSPDNPLTARVIVNRIWQAHFGEGLVRTPDNFGIRGETPSHPELLDWLALEFMRSGWDVKQLHRLILTSGTWRQVGSGDAGGDQPSAAESLPPRTDASRLNAASIAQASKADPDNRLLWHFPRQRLEAEMIRDALLAVSGRLDATAGGSLVAWKNDEYTPTDTVSASSVRRSVYLPVVRDRVFDVFTIFDFANPSVGTSKRIPTVVSHQALFFLNSPLVKESAGAFAQELRTAVPDNAEARIRLAYERAFGRLPTATETRRAGQFMASLPRKEPAKADEAAWAAWCQMLFAANEFIYRE